MLCCLCYCFLSTIYFFIIWLLLLFLLLENIVVGGCTLLSFTKLTEIMIFRWFFFLPWRPFFVRSISAIYYYYQLLSLLKLNLFPCLIQRIYLLLQVVVPFSSLTRIYNWLFAWTLHEEWLVIEQNKQIVLATIYLDWEPQTIVLM